ncbi:phytoene/squalene synthase family protein [Streptomyces violascens]|uniref:phytoene/squalene synthase family protein n=1 Tax=Streptomyces violascens TaxID=67381 RepID=UPI0036535D93
MTVQELDLAGIKDSGLRSDYLTASRLFKEIGRGRFLGRYMFPKAKRPYFDTFFAFVCYIDDIADEVDHSLEIRAQRLDEWDRTYQAVLKGEQLPEPWQLSKSQQTDAALARALIHTMRTWDLPYLRVPEFVEGHRKAMNTFEYADDAHLDEFIQTVSLLPAVWINQIFEPLHPEAETLCRETITAFQLIDFVWDVEEDLELGRLYLPNDHLARYNLTREDLTRQIGSGSITDSVRELMEYEIGVARSHLEAGRAWPSMLHPTSRTFMETDIKTHEAMFAELTKNDFAFFKQPQKGGGEASAPRVPPPPRGRARPPPGAPPPRAQTLPPQSPPWNVRLMTSSCCSRVRRTKFTA